jgi:predicted AAA+ superfamily ATPase
MKRELIFKAQKFYFFDAGLMNTLKTTMSPFPSEDKGHTLESYIFQELNAYRLLQEEKKSLHFWRTKSGIEVDFILNQTVAIEVKSTSSVHTGHLKGLIAFAEEHAPKDLILVCNEETPQLMTHKGYNIKILNVAAFLERLWDGEFA